MNCNLTFVTSPQGILKVLQILFGFLCWALTAEFSSSWSHPHQFVMFVSVTSWILTVIFFVMFLLGLHDSKCSGAPWAAIDFCFNMFWSLFYVTASCVSAAFTGSRDQLIAATFFAFFATACYFINSATSFRMWRGSFPWQSNRSAHNVNT